VRLIEAKTLALHRFFGNVIPPYAILFHTWGKEEVTFQEWTKKTSASLHRGRG
jgi:hypothetical protein